MTDREYQKDLAQINYHLTETVKLHAKLIEANKQKSDQNDNRIHALEKDVAVMHEKIKARVAIMNPNIEQMELNRRRSVKEAAQDTSIAGIILGILYGLVELAKKYFN